MSCCSHGSHSSPQPAAVAPSSCRPLVRVCTHGGVVGEVNEMVNPELQLKWQSRLLIVRILDAVAQRASDALFEAVRRSGAAALDNAVQLWAQEFIGGALTKHACSEMVKPVERLRHTGAGAYHGSINIDTAAEHGIFTSVHVHAGLRFHIVRFRNDCTPPGAEINDVAWVHITALLEYLTAELTEIAGVAARAASNGQSSAISAAHLRTALLKDEEFSLLLVKLGLASELERTDDGIGEAELLASFPRTQAVMNDLLRYAWWNHEGYVDRTLRQFLSGTLPQGSMPHAYLQHSHLRPVRYYGRSRRGVFVGDDVFTSEAFVQSDDSSIDSMEGLFLNLCSFDVIDAEGREFQILHELRFGYERHVNTEHGIILDRRTGEEIVESVQLEDQRKILRFNSLEARKFWARYVPHRRSEPVHTASVVPSAASAPAAAASGSGDVPAELSADVVRELRSIFDVSWGLVENFSESRLETQSVWSAAQPDEVVKRFTLAWLQAGFGQLPESLSGAVGSAGASSAVSSESALPYMPVDLLRLIGEYCPIDLPYLPLTVDPNAALPASVTVCPARTDRPSGLVPSSGGQFDFFCLREEDGATDSE